MKLQACRSGARAPAWHPGRAAAEPEARWQVSGRWLCRARGAAGGRCRRDGGGRLRPDPARLDARGCRDWLFNIHAFAVAALARRGADPTGRSRPVTARRASRLGADGPYSSRRIGRCWWKASTRRPTPPSLHDRLAGLRAYDCRGTGDRGLRWPARTPQPVEGVNYAHKIEKAEALGSTGRRRQ